MFFFFAKKTLRIMSKQLILSIIYLNFIEYISFKARCRPSQVFCVYAISSAYPEVVLVKNWHWEMGSRFVRRYRTRIFLIPRRCLRSHWLVPRYDLLDIFPNEGLQVERCESWNLFFPLLASIACSLQCKNVRIATINGQKNYFDNRQI